MSHVDLTLITLASFGNTLASYDIGPNPVRLKSTTRTSPTDRLVRLSYEPI
jgi:hypothetical protein